MATVMVAAVVAAIISICSSCVLGVLIRGKLNVILARQVKVAPQARTSTNLQSINSRDEKNFVLMERVFYDSKRHLLNILFLLSEWNCSSL